MNKTTNRLISLLLTAAIVCSMALALPMTASAAENGTCGANLAWTLDDNGTLTINGTGEMEDYYFSEARGTNVPWYDFRDKITAVKIEEGVTNIGERAFWDCTTLTSVTVPDSVTSIGDAAFQGCKSLTSITIPDSVTSIGHFAFDQCASLTSIIIPDSVTSIGNRAFNNTAYYNEPANWAENVLYIGNHLIETKTSLSGTYNIREGTKTIADDAFWNCTTLTSITIPDSVTSIGNRAFGWCKSLTSIEVQTDNATYTSIDGVLFSKDKTELLCYPTGKAETNYIIPDSVTSIGGWAFYGCTSLKSVTIPDSVTSIGEYAFSGCTSLTSVTIPDSVTSIGHFAFDQCASLTSIIIPDSVTSIGGWAFDGCTSLTSITIPDGVTSISDSAFIGCTSLKSVTIPDSVTSIGEYAFCECTSLTSIIIPNSVTSIGAGAFAGCTSLTSVTIPDSVTSIGGGAFGRCESLTSITIPNSVTSIGAGVFSGCSSLTSITIPDGVTSIGSSAFSGCSSLTSVTIPDSVTSIGEEAFNNTAYYNEPANWSENVLYIGNHLIDSKTSLGGTYNIRGATKTIAGGAFSGCTSLTSIIIPNSVTSIGSSAFAGCTSLTSVTIPNSVTSIGGWAFYGCTSLTSIIIPNSVTSIGEYAFCECTSLTSVTIPNSVTGIGDCAFLYCNKCTIYGNDGSYAQKYANDNNIPFALLSPVNNIFSDVFPGEWYVSAVQYAVDNKLFFGVSDNEFAPDAAMNRAMLVTVLWRLEGKPTQRTRQSFADVPANEWYANAVAWASENGVVYGTSENEFSPEDSITREQMAAILYRYAKKKGYDTTASTALNTFPDGGHASAYARDALSWACGAGLIFGSDGKLLPQDGATRAQVAAILMRYTNKVVQK